MTTPLTPEEWRAAAAGDGVELVAADEVRAIPVRWAWEGRLALGSLTLIVGQVGLGKTLLAGELAARISRGQLPGDLDAPAAVVITTAEDSLSHTLVPRLMAAGADLSRVHFVTVRREGLEVGLTLPDDVAALEERVAEVKAGLLIIDPVMAHLADALDSHRDHSIRRALAPLHRLAEATEAAVVGIGHLNKAPSTDVLYRVGGSVGLTAAVRSVLLVAPDPKAPDEPGARVLVQGKNNLGPRAVSLRLRVEGRVVEGPDGAISTAGIAWAGEAPDVTAGDVLVPPPSDEERTEREEAESFLRQALAEAPVPAATVQAEARRLGLAGRTLARARSRLGVVARKEGFGESGRWVLELPEDPKGASLQSVAPLEGHEPESLLESQAAQGDSVLPLRVPTLRVPQGGGTLSGEAAAVERIREWNAGRPPSPIVEEVAAWWWQRHRLPVEEEA